MRKKLLSVNSGPALVDSTPKASHLSSVYLDGNQNTIIRRNWTNMKENNANGANKIEISIPSGVFLAQDLEHLKAYVCEMLDDFRNTAS